MLTFFLEEFNTVVDLEMYASETPITILLNGISAAKETYIASNSIDIITLMAGAFALTFVMGHMYFMVFAGTRSNPYFKKELEEIISGNVQNENTVRTRDNINNNYSKDTHQNTTEKQTILHKEKEMLMCPYCGTEFEETENGLCPLCKAQVNKQNSLN